MVEIIYTVKSAEWLIKIESPKDTLSSWKLSYSRVMSRESNTLYVLQLVVTYMEFASHLSVQETTILISVSWDEKLVQIAVSICHKVCNWVKHPIQSIRYTEEDDREYNTHSAAERVSSYFHEQYHSLH